MGTQSSKCCCREDLEGDRFTEGAGKAPANYVNYDDGIPMYNAAPAFHEGQDHMGSWNQGYEEGGYFAPPPQHDDGFGGYAEPPGPSVPDQSKKEKKEKKTKSKQEEAKPTQDHARERERVEEPPAPRVEAESKYDNPVVKAEEPQRKPEEPKRPVNTGPEDKVFGYPGKTLQIQLDSGWSDYGEAEMKQINDHLRAGSKRFAITTRGAMYMLDMENPSNVTQTNPTTKKIRSLRLATDAEKARGGGGAPARDANQAAGQQDKAEKVDERAGKKGCCVIS